MPLSKPLFNYCKNWANCVSFVLLLAKERIHNNPLGNTVQRVSGFPVYPSHLMATQEKDTLIKKEVGQIRTELVFLLPIILNAVSDILQVNEIFRR